MKSKICISIQHNDDSISRCLPPSESRNIKSIILLTRLIFEKHRKNKCHDFKTITITIQFHENSRKFRGVAKIVFIFNELPDIFFFCRNVESLAEKFNTLPIFIDADEKSTITNGPIGGQTRVSLRNDHLSYLITWFSLSAATTLMWIKKYAIK